MFYDNILKRKILFMGWGILGKEKISIFFEVIWGLRLGVIYGTFLSIVFVRNSENVVF